MRKHLRHFFWPAVVVAAALSVCCFGEDSQRDVPPDHAPGLIHAGFFLGGGIGMSHFGSKQAHDFVLTKVTLGRVMSRELAPDRWYSGHFELLGELSAAHRVSPATGFVGGLTPVIRYDFVNGSRWAPFVDAGIGLMLTDIRKPDLSTTFQFNDTVGAGVRWFFSPSSALNVHYRFSHLSNGGIRKPNNGVNVNQFWLGISRYF